MRLMVLAKLALFFLLMVIAGCSDSVERSPPPPTGEEQPVRIVSLSPGVTTTLLHRGHDPAIVARHGWDTVADSRLPIAGDQTGINYEAMLSAQPTHIFLQWGSRELPERLVELGAQRGWVIENFGSLSWDDVAKMELRLSAMLGPAEGEMAERPVRMGRLEPAAELIEHRQSIGKLLLLLPGAEPAALGPGSFHYEMATEQLGCAMVGPLDGPYVRLHAEDLVRLTPDAIVLLVPRGEREAGGDAFEASRWRAELGRLADLGLPATESGRVAVLDHPRALLAGSSLADVRAELGAIIDRWAVAGPNAGP